MGKFYAVRVGHRPGVYSRWQDVQPLVSGYPGAQHKSFRTREAAEDYLDAGPYASGRKREQDDDDFGGDCYNDDERYLPQARIAHPSPNQYEIPRSSRIYGERRLDDDNYGGDCYKHDERYFPQARIAHTSPQQYEISPSRSIYVKRKRDDYDFGADRSNYSERLPQTRVAHAGGSSYAPVPAPFRPVADSYHCRVPSGSTQSSRFEPVVEGPLHAVRSDCMYELEFDGASRGNPGHAGCGVVLRCNGEMVCRLRKYMGSHFTNNEAEYTALLEGLKMARRLGVTRIHAKGDSKLVVNQVNGRWNINKDHLRELCEQVHRETQQLREFQIRHVLRHLNGDADGLSNDAIDLA